MWELELEWDTGDIPRFREVLFDVAEQDVGDLFEFEISQAGQMTSSRKVASRYMATAMLAERPFEEVSVYLNFRLGEMSTETLQTEGILNFAEIEPVSVEAVPIELQVAEKIYDYVSAHRAVVESGGARDLFDLSMIAERSALNPSGLRVALQEVFDAHSAELPEELQSPPVEWAASFIRFADKVGVSGSLVTGHDAVAAFLNPVLGGEARAGIWNARRREWIDPSANGHFPPD